MLIYLFHPQIPPEQSQKTASDLDMNVADYKSQLEQSFEPSTSYQWSLNDNNLTVRKFTSSDISFRLLVVQLEEVDLLKSLPDFMAAIAKSITQLSEDLREKESLVEKLSKRKFSYKTMNKETKVAICLKNVENTKLLEKCNEYVKIKEDMTVNLHTYFAEAFNHLKERVGVGSSAGLFKKLLKSSFICSFALIYLSRWKFRKSQKCTI